MRLIVALLFVLLAAAQASAAPCTGWLKADFWKTATLADVQGCLATSPVNARDEDGFTPLHRAAAFSTTPAIISALLDAGAEVNARTEGGQTPLHLAAMWSKTPAIITALLDAGAEVDARNKYGWTPLHYAAENSKTPAIVTALLDAGAEVNARDEVLGSTPLHHAAMSSTTPAIVTALLKAGADARAVDKDGRKPLDYARDNKALAGSDAFWRLNDASY